MTHQRMVEPQDDKRAKFLAEATTFLKFNSEAEIKA
jgi:uncharacterized membrane protein